MVVVKSFCFYFSCRLGSIIVGVFNLIQILMWLGLCINNLVNSKILSENIEELLDDEELDLSDISDTLINIKNDPAKLLNCGIAFFTIFGLSCFAMMYGVYKLKIYIVLPFVMIDFFYITTLLVLYVMGLLILKKNDHGLGPLILFSIMGEFLFLYKYYTWFVVVSYCQILREMKNQVTTFSFIGQQNNKINLGQHNDKLLMFSQKPPPYPAHPRKY